MEKQYETVIGLEVHVELATKTKIFCGCSTAFGGAPNTHTCPVCTGMPGSLPVLNKQVVEYAMAVGLATNCDITRYCKFDRKNYFYPDNPQNYQISQLYLPICRNGYVEIETDGGSKKVGIHEIHMEEDAGKLIHDEWEGASLVDYNRSGVPLIEIVSEPDMRSAEEVIAYLEKLRLIIQYLGASDCKLQEGSMRADVNISVREYGAEEYGTRCEMKNLNSFKAIARAIEGERARQIDLIEAGEKVIQETRRWDDAKECSYAMRSKEDAQDYRYFPDPDLLPIVISEEWIQKVLDAQPEFRSAKQKRYKEQFDLPDYDIDILTNSKHLADLFEECEAICHLPKKVSNWLMVETMRLVKEREMDASDIRFS
ncbi:MAG: Asp-tRNA(Asn)/Glu-tRNA(Gln) amidotransferase subunit GatB, partial [Lachnospiraceae bacterium]|nr:Asp-tRNA(Asn)/Glu-tRNA(Gln) amidotransferase subunit GatB [Lachnospiraceae bacterium]